MNLIPMSAHLPTKGVDNLNHHDFNNDFVKVDSIPQYQLVMVLVR
jgi:hypothetical protein